MTSGHRDASHDARSAQWAAFALLLLVATMLGGNVVAARLAMDQGADLVTTVAVRSVLTALVASALVMALDIPRRLQRRHWRAMPVVCALVGLQSLCLYAAAQRLPVVLAVLIFNTHPVWSALLDFVLYRRTPGRAVLLVMPVVLAGLALALDLPAALAGASAAASPGLSLTGIALAVLAAASFGAMLLLSQREVADLDGRYRTAITMSVVGSLALLVSLAAGGPRWPGSAAGWWALAAVSVLYGCAFTILVTVLPRLGVVGYSPVLGIEPVAALLLAALVLGQQIAAMQAVGVVLAASAVFALGLHGHGTAPMAPSAAGRQSRASDSADTRS